MSNNQEKAHSDSEQDEEADNIPTVAFNPEADADLQNTESSAPDEFKGLSLTVEHKEANLDEHFERIAKNVAEQNYDAVLTDVSHVLNVSCGTSADAKKVRALLLDLQTRGLIKQGAEFDVMFEPLMSPGGTQRAE